MREFPASDIFRRLGSRILVPAVAIMSRLSYAEKFTLISLLFILPTGWVTTGFVLEINKRIDFAARELQGTNDLRPLRRLLEEVTTSRRLMHWMNFSRRCRPYDERR
ncbi:MAG: hypothetical protein WKF77_10680 [Planctomycetaceae bacterium]